MLPLTEDDLARIEHRARRSGIATGTLANDVMRLLQERRRLLMLLTQSSAADRTALDPGRLAACRDTSGG